MPQVEFVQPAGRLEQIANAWLKSNDVTVTRIELTKALWLNIKLILEYEELSAPEDKPRIRVVRGPMPASASPLDPSAENQLNGWCFDQASAGSPVAILSKAEVQKLGVGQVIAALWVKRG